jgi:protein-glucosylgalactosylhydroxylysine glucosidase
VACYQVNDSITTNNAFRLALVAAGEAAAALSLPATPAWAEVAEKLFFYFNETSGVHPEYSTYQGETVKQGDVILLGWPYLFDFNRSQGGGGAAARANDLRYYAKRTDPGGPAMTWAMFAVGWLDAGNQTAADANFARGHATQKEPFQVWTETVTGGAVNFITGAGGFVQSVVFGYAGVRIVKDKLTLTPQQMPPDTDGITLHGLHYRGQRLTLTASRQGTRVSILGDNCSGVRSIPKHECLGFVLFSTVLLPLCECDIAAAPQV